MASSYPAMGSVIVASASSVAKIFLIGLVGYYAVIRPVGNPLLPVHSIGMVSRLIYEILLLPLFFTGIASSISLSTILSLWQVPVAAWFVIATSYISSTVMGWIMRIDTTSPDFRALRIAASYPNIVVLPILIFPTLCEYEVVHGGFSGAVDECTLEANAIVFSYSFGYNILFWSVGNQALVNVGGNHSDTWAKILQDVVGNSGFIAVLLGTVIACIPPFQKALFQNGGVLRFAGSALEALTQSGATLATVVVAASLAGLGTTVHSVSGQRTASCTDEEDISDCNEVSMDNDHSESISECDNLPHSSESPLDQCQRVVEVQKTPPFRKKIQNVCHIFSRLILTPSLVCMAFLGFKSFGITQNMPHLFHLVVLVNSSVPGALIMVVILKKEGLSDSASTISQAYLWSYPLSVFTVAAWTSVGIILFM